MRKEDNARDAKERNLIQRGEQIFFSKLKETEVFKILTAKETPLNIASQYNISIGHAKKILNRQVWGHVIIP